VVQAMLVFVDESGDTGLKLDKGSSKYFVITLVVFEEHDEALDCDKRIELLKKELGIKNEFKFSKLNVEKRKVFFEALIPYSFFYFAVVIDKENNNLGRFMFLENFYKYSCSLVFEIAKPYLKDAVVVIDGNGSKEFRFKLQSYLKLKTGAGVIKKIKIHDSRQNNLLQLADMVAGAIHRDFSDKTDKNTYRKILSTKEFDVRIWPKK
jgi:hypothetical protein